MKKIIILTSVMFLIITSGCEKFDLNSKKSKTEISIHPLGNYLFSDIAIRKIDRIEENTIHFTGGNYATQTEITETTSFEVDPGQYYVFLRYTNLSTFVSGWWKTVGSNLIEIKEGEKWSIKYGYSGGTVTKD